MTNTFAATGGAADRDMTHPMDNIAVRPLKFDPASSDPIWSQSSPEFAMFINALGIDVPHFERFLVKVMREHRGALDNPQLLEDVQAIIGQESHHAFNFNRWTNRLIEKYPALERVNASCARSFARLAKRGKKFQIGFVAGYETFTFLGGLIILQRYQELMAEADPVMRGIWVWHQVEEVEHGAVAFDFYQAFYGKHEWYRKGLVILAFTHILGETFKAYAPMVGGEGLYKTPRLALRAWRFFARFGLDLAISALPVLKRNYHPRNHPICNNEQNQIAVAWRNHYQNGGNVKTLNDDIMRLLQGT